MSGPGVGETSWPAAAVAELVGELEVEEVAEEEEDDDEDDEEPLGMELGFVDVTLPLTIHFASEVPQQVELSPPQHQLSSGH